MGADVLARRAHSHPATGVIATRTEILNQNNSGVLSYMFPIWSIKDRNHKFIQIVKSLLFPRDWVIASVNSLFIEKNGVSL